MSSREIKAELTLELPELLTYLDDLLGGMRQGKVYVEHRGETVALAPHGAVDVEIRAKHKKDKEKLTLELAWRRAPEPPPGPELRITSHGSEESP
ncbi:MAG: amphi-Trp domain-containing protein [Myxococcales bacterium]|jgi:amphi-Trp domain-containing protein